MISEKPSLLERKVKSVLSPQSSPELVTAATVVMIARAADFVTGSANIQQAYNAVSSSPQFITELQKHDLRSTLNKLNRGKKICGANQPPPQANTSLVQTTPEEFHAKLAKVKEGQAKHMEKRVKEDQWNALSLAEQEKEKAVQMTERTERLQKSGANVRPAGMSQEFKSHLKRALEKKRTEFGKI